MSVGNFVQNDDVKLWRKTLGLRSPVQDDGRKEQKDIGRFAPGIENQTEDEKIMAEMIATSYDISDAKYIEPIVEYLEAA